MASIPWWAWLGIGAFIAITSAVFGGKLVLFIWAGLLFILIGIGKAVYVFMMQEKPENHVQSERHILHNSQNVQHHTQHQLHCPRCKTTVQANDYFCRLCGLRLR